MNLEFCFRIDMPPSPTQFLRNVAPDFMWCTWHDLYLMYEQIDEDIDYQVFKQTLSYMKRCGYFVTKQSTAPSWRNGPKPLLYLRVTPHMLMKN